MLRFTLEKVWPDGPHAYPPPMAGRIEVVKSDRQKSGDAGEGEGESDVQRSQAIAEERSSTERTPSTRLRDSAVRAPRFVQARSKPGDGATDIVTEDCSDDLVEDVDAVRSCAKGGVEEGRGAGMTRGTRVACGPERQMRHCLPGC